jgi:hypothetical protein
MFRQWLVASLVLLTAAGGAYAGDPLVAGARRAREAIREFGKASRAKEPQGRIEAVRALGTVVHERVADRLLRFLRREDDNRVLTATVRTLAHQAPFAADVVAGLADRLRSEAEAAKRRLRQGDAGFLVDPRTGGADSVSAEARAKLEETRERAGMVVALFATLETLGWTPEKSQPDVTPFLQDPDDELVTATLATLARWKEWSALPAVLELYRMYPTEYQWETGAVVDLGGTNATAKATWMVRFGHPDKQRARPDVARGLRAYLEVVTGRSFDTPAKLAVYISDSDVRRKIEGGGRRR